MVRELYGREGPGGFLRGLGPRCVLSPYIIIVIIVIVEASD